MESQSLQYPLQDVSLNPLGKFGAQMAQYGQNASNNRQETVTAMTIHGWLRLLVIVGGYMLLRPLALKFIAKGAVRKMEEADEKEKAMAKITPNELRGAKAQLEEQDDEDTGDGTAVDWGQKARRRQRQLLKAMLEAEELRKQEEEDDKDIDEFLTG